MQSQVVSGVHPPHAPHTHTPPPTCVRALLRTNPPPTLFFHPSLLFFPSLLLCLSVSSSLSLPWPFILPHPGRSLPLLSWYFSPLLGEGFLVESCSVSAGRRRGSAVIRQTDRWHLFHHLKQMPVFYFLWVSCLRYGHFTSRHLGVAWQMLMLFLCIHVLLNFLKSSHRNALNPTLTLTEPLVPDPNLNPEPNPILCLTP